MTLSRVALVSTSCLPVIVRRRSLSVAAVKRVRKRCLPRREELFEDEVEVKQKRFRRRSRCFSQKAEKVFITLTSGHWG